MLFAGDIMAHSENYAMKDFSLIWKDVTSTVKNADLAFANNEAPVIDKKDWQTFPYFNMHSDYVQAEIDAGFNVFSLVNNHSNDQGKEGILSTRATFASLAEKNSTEDRKIYFSGIKTPDNDGFDYVKIEKNGFSILFLAVTEILNQNSYKSYLNFVYPGEDGIKKLSNFIKTVREKEMPDLFVLSFHSAEEEYVRKVSEARRKQYRTYLSSGADIVWANHPHVVRERELYGIKDSGVIEKIVFYGNGNTISGQRRNPQYKSPYTERDYTGDGLLFEVKIVRQKNANDDIDAICAITETKPHYITTYIDKNRNFILKNLNEAFIQSLEDEGQTLKASYFRERKKITESTKEHIIWQ